MLRLAFDASTASSPKEKYASAAILGSPVRPDFHAARTRSAKGAAISGVGRPRSTLRPIGQPTQGRLAAAADQDRNPCMVTAGSGHLTLSERLASPGAMHGLERPVELGTLAVEVDPHEVVVVRTPPGASPRVSRPREIRSIVAAVLASSTGGYAGASRMFVSSSIQLVVPATAARVASESWLG